MKKTNILLMVIVILTTISCSCADTEHEKEVKKQTYFLDEDFEIIKITESPKMWVIQRVINSGDSIEVAEIDDVESRNFYITKELWYNKSLGDILHFDYILKSRFIKIKSDRKLFLISENESEKQNLNKITEIKNLPDTNESTTVETDNLDNLDLERKLLSLETQLQSIQNEIDKIRYEIED